MFLETKSKFNNGNPKRGQSDVKSRNFFNWSNNNQYRSSYHDMYSKVRDYIAFINIGIYDRHKLSRRHQ